MHAILAAVALLGTGLLTPLALLDNTLEPAAHVTPAPLVLPLLVFEAGAPGAPDHAGMDEGMHEGMTGDHDRVHAEHHGSDDGHARMHEEHRGGGHAHPHGENHHTPS